MSWTVKSLEIERSDLSNEADERSKWRKAAKVIVEGGKERREMEMEMEMEMERGKGETEASLAGRTCG